MQILVDRYLSSNEATLSRIYINGEFECFGLEDEFREQKVRGETRIPAGAYKVAMRTEGGFHTRYSKDRRFRDIHTGMLWIRDVPNFEYILIHVGNFEKDTDGCLLVGATRDEERMCVYRSSEAYRKFYLKVRSAAERGQLFINYEDSDRR